MDDKTKLSITAITGIVLLEAVALYKEIDGALFMGSLALIGGIAGYEFKDMKNKITTIKNNLF